MAVVRVIMIFENTERAKREQFNARGIEKFTVYSQLSCKWQVQCEFSSFHKFVFISIYWFEKQIVYVTESKMNEQQIRSVISIWRVLFNFIFSNYFSIQWWREFIGQFYNLNFYLPIRLLGFSFSHLLFVWYLSMPSFLHFIQASIDSNSRENHTKN